MGSDAYYEVLESAGDVIYHEYFIHNMNELTARKCFSLIMQVAKELTVIEKSDSVKLANNFRNRF